MVCAYLKSVESKIPYQKSSAIIAWAEIAPAREKKLIEAELVAMKHRLACVDLVRAMAMTDSDLREEGNTPSTGIGFGQAAIKKENADRYHSTKMKMQQANAAAMGHTYDHDTRMYTFSEECKEDVKMHKSGFGYGD